MNYNRRPNPAQLEASAEHRRREDTAARLRDEVPPLLSLRVTFEELRTEGGVQATSYVRPIVVASAPAHFEVRCMEPKCDGRHDLTASILRALKQSLASFTGQSTCDGMVADTPCHRTLGYTCEATYRSA